MAKFMEMNNLIKIAAIGGVATVSMGFFARYNLNKKIADTEYYKEAMTILRSHAGAILLLGEPIQDKTIDVGDEKINYTKELTAHYVVPVQGAKQKGTMYFWANRGNLEEQWFVSRIELGFKNQPSRRLLVKGETQK